MRIACLHTAASNVAVFDGAAKALGLKLVHQVRPDLLAQAEAAGGLTPALRQETSAALQDLAAEADAVILTCSTLGPTVEAGSKMQRADAALARQVAALAGPVAVLCAAPTTWVATTQLFVGSKVTLVPSAWALFKAGHHDACAVLIAEAADTAIAAGATAVAFAQVSMTPAAALSRRCIPLTVPKVSLDAALALAYRDAPSK